MSVVWRKEHSLGCDEQLAAYRIQDTPEVRLEGN